MQRVFLSFPLANSKKLSITGDNARYLNSVLRVRSGDSVVLFDPGGEHFEADVMSVSKGRVEVEISASLGRGVEPEGGVTLVLGLLKGSKMELVIQKSVELGVAAIIPVETERTVVRETRKLDRWRKVALEAARQCGRPLAPPVEPPVSLAAYIDSADAPLKGIAFYEGRGLEPLVPGDMDSMPGESVVIAVGPEGGFTSSEVEMMLSGGLQARTLGGNILRAETAAIAAVTLAQYLRGRLGRLEVLRKDDTGIEEERRQD